MKKSQKIFIGVGFLGIAVIIAYFIWKNRQDSLPEKQTDPDNPDDPFAPDDTTSTGSNITDGGFGNGDLLQEQETSAQVVEIKKNLQWIANENVAKYLQEKLNDNQITKLRGWVELIKKERLADPSKWGDNSGLTGQTSDIGHGLYQMEIWNQEVMFALKDA